MKSWMGAYILGGMSMLGVWLVYENKQRLDAMMKSVAAKADQMLQEMKNTTMNCKCNESLKEC